MQYRRKEFRVAAWIISNDMGKNLVIAALIAILLLNFTPKDAKSINKPAKKIAYLTFDDGPSVNTDKILDVLEKYKIHATFFVNGRPALISTYKRIVEEGNAIGNHTYSHDYKTVYSSEEGFIVDVDKLSKFLEDAGIYTTMVRFPGGSNNHVSIKFGGKDIMKQLVKDVLKDKFWYCDWNVDSGDSDVPVQDTKIIVDNVLKQSKKKNRVVILMHDAPIKTTTPLALPSIINGLKKEGFDFGVLAPDVKPIRFRQ
jgi:peptidoglycan/xylan/chitin deacetylase (PgdA/CDA1 family)